ncbi:protein kinase domain-containing protein [Mesorhizobium sp. A623]
MDTMDGDLIPYREMRLLREGSMTTAFHAVDADGAEVIVKRLNHVKDAAVDLLGVRRFEREIALSMMVDHPGLARVTSHGANWIAFEYLEHPAANDERKKSLASPTGISRLIGDLADILAYLHSRGVVHRDVKPAHVMFRGNQPVLIDLGVAGLMGDDPLDGTELIGSPAWMAPEQIAGAKAAPSADIWSLCAVGVALVRGRPLFSGSAEGVLNRRRNEARELICLSDYLEDAPDLKALLEAGLGEASTRPSAAAIAAALGLVAG